MIEYIWQTDQNIRQDTPILFPIVGRLKIDSYIYKDKNILCSTWIC